MTALDELRSQDEYENSAEHARIAKVRHIQQQMDDLASALLDYLPPHKAIAGCVVTLDRDGELAVVRGLIRSEDRDAAAALVNGADEVSTPGAEAVALPPAKTRPVHSQPLVDRLTAQYAAAIQAELMVRPNLALCLLVAQMMVDVTDHVEHGCAWKRWFDLHASSAEGDLVRVAPELESALSLQAVRQRLEGLQQAMPKPLGALVPWLLAQPQDAVLQILALLLSCTVYRRCKSWQGAQPDHLHALAREVGLDMAKWWQPTAETYLNHVSKDRIAQVVAQAVSVDTGNSLRAMKKDGAISVAETTLAGKGWLPEPLLTPPAEPVAGDEVADGAADDLTPADAPVEAGIA